MIEPKPRRKIRGNIALVVRGGHARIEDAVVISGHRTREAAQIRAGSENMGLGGVGPNRAFFTTPTPGGRQICEADGFVDTDTGCSGYICIDGIVRPRGPILIGRFICWRDADVHFVPHVHTFTSEKPKTPEDPIDFRFRSWASGKQKTNPRCPACNSFGAYIGFSEVVCPNPDCVHGEAAKKSLKDLQEELRSLGMYGWP
jgi:hypothetical protein